MNRTLKPQASRKPVMRLIATALAIGLGLVAAPAIAQTAPAPKRLDLGVANGPTTKILAEGRWTAKATVASVGPVMASEVHDTVSLYLGGVIDQWFVKQDGSGVVFLLNSTDVARAQSALEALPLGQGGLMTFQLTPLGPISPLRTLIAAPPR